MFPAPFAGESAVASEPRQGVGLGFFAGHRVARGLFLFQMMEVIHHTHDAKDILFFFVVAFFPVKKHSNREIFLAKEYIFSSQVLNQGICCSI